MQDLDIVDYTPLSKMHLRLPAFIYKNRAWEQFGKANNWPVESPGLTEELVPPAINRGTWKRISKVIQAQIGETLFQIFTYSFQTGSRGTLFPHHYTIALVRLPLDLPRIQLTSIRDHWLSRDFANATRLDLEGNFSAYYELRIEKNQQVDALSILTPEIMQSLIDHHHKGSIEIVGSRLFFILAGDKRGAQQMHQLITTVSSLTPLIIRNLQAQNYHLSVEGQ